jgi:L-rhamnose isomerase/sugar isomerase
VIKQHESYQILAEQLDAHGLDVESIKERLKKQTVETASWAYANSGTRFKAFAWPGAAVTTKEKLDDAAMVNRLTGITPSVAVHIPWDRPADNDFNAVRQYAHERGLRIGGVNPNVFQDDEYKLGSLTHPDAAIQERALDHCIECVGIMQTLGSSSLSVWLGDGTNYAGQDNLRERKRRLQRNLEAIYAQMPDASRLFLEYKFFEPAFYSTDIPDWGTAYMLALHLGPKAQVLVDLGHHAHGTNIEQIVTFLVDEGRLGGFHFNARKYADDDLIVGSVNPYELFLIYNELAAAEESDDETVRNTALNVAYALDQCHNIEGKIAAIIYSVLNCQEAYARALCVPRAQLRELQLNGNVLGGHQLLTNAFRTDVRPLLAQVRHEMGIAPDPIAAYWASGYEEKIQTERGVAASSGGGFQ